MPFLSRDAMIGLSTIASKMTIANSRRMGFKTHARHAAKIRSTKSLSQRFKSA